ncbi:MAG: cardiolipin synthase [Lachnospiraceae bacterium]|nr:cardiolipin synthase [Lachnospiraceae bacterium]
MLLNRYATSFKTDSFNGGLTYLNPAARCKTGRIAVSGTVKTIEKKSSVKNGIGRLALTAVSVILEVTVIVVIALRLNAYAEWIAIGTRILAAFLVLAIYVRNTTSAMKIPWIILIMTFPVLGVTLYLLIGFNGSTRSMRKRYDDIDCVLLPKLPKNREIIESLQDKSGYLANIARYVHEKAGYPIYQNTDIEYYDDAAVGLAAQKEALQRAEKFIFMEYHAIEDSESWHGIQNILEERVQAGVEVRVFYDDMGSIGFINTDFVKRMESKGIRCRVFNPFIPGLKVFLNNRDHRKITVIDGKVGFTGGYNLADEYFHVTQPYGYWKDTGIKLTGDAVKSLTVTFLEMWNAVKNNDRDDQDFDRYLSGVGYQALQKGYVQPYADSPMDNEHVGEEVYISVAESAEKYAWFITPYLIITDEMTHALSLAAKRGVDVRIITPGIPDKKMVYSMTRSFYNGLVRNGVRIFEYTPGFCHCKMSVSDDRVATCGTINLDYRSLYHHFENGCLYYDCQAVLDTKQDFENTFRECREVTYAYRSGRGQFLRLQQLLLRLIAPLL